MAIEGIKLSITSVDLKKLCEDRIKYHLGRAEWNATKLKELEPTFKEANADFEEEAFEQMKGMSYNSNARSGDPLERFKTSHAHHRDRATVFRFMAEHIIPNESYVLAEADLRKLEVMRAAW